MGLARKDQSPRQAQLAIVAITEAEHDSITTGGMEKFSANVAIETAKEAIDDGEMS